LLFWGWETIQKELVKNAATFFRHYPLFTTIPILEKPKIDCKVNTRDEHPEVVVINNDPGQFEIMQVAFMRINIYGFEDTANHSVIRAPFITFSRMRKDFEDKNHIILNGSNAFACAFICSYDEKMVSFVKNKIYNMRLTNGPYAALPSLQSVKYYVYLWLKNKYKEPSEMAFLTRHIHGHGYDQIAIEPQDFGEALQYYNVPKFTDPKLLWDHIIKKYSLPASEVYGNGIPFYT
jgi:hypothetical protein